MNGMPDFFIPNPDDRHLDNLLDHPRRITLRRANGTLSELEAKPRAVEITEEHPQVDRMSGDWGAICEVFRKNNYYYLSVAGVTPAVGDEIRVYGNGNTVVELKVIELENGRARIEAPAIRQA